MEITLSVSTYIWRIKIEFHRDENDQVEKKPVPKTSIGDVEALEFSIAKLASKVKISSFSPLLPFFCTPFLITDAQVEPLVKDNQRSISKATI